MGETSECPADLKHSRKTFRLKPRVLHYCGCAIFALETPKEGKVEYYINKKRKKSTRKAAAARRAQTDGSSFKGVLVGTLGLNTSANPLLTEIECVRCILFA